MTDVKKSEIYPVFGCEICFVAIYALFGLNCFVAIYALLCGKKLSQKLYRWRKNDKYEVWYRVACVWTKSKGTGPRLPKAEKENKRVINVCRVSNQHRAGGTTEREWNWNEKK